ncbi:hypothetical protein NL108_011804, partial [Boleophthalmus pectinirostris]
TQDSTTGQMYHCRFCPKVFDTAFGLRVHDRAHKKCIACKKVFPFPSVLKQHEGRCKYYKELMRIIKQLTCKKCLKRFTSRSLLLKHSCNFACPVCSEMFTSQMNLKVHTKKMHNNSTDNGLEQSWAQPLDETEGNQGLSSCEIYIRKCSGGFQCVICKKVCVTKCNAVDHYYSHTGEKPYTCDVCSKKFSKTSALNHHSITTHVNRRPYTCPYCGKFFTYPSHQRQHLLCHTGVRLPLCQFCEKRFLTQSELTAHTCTYKGERPFGCGQCGRHFARSRNLRAHQRNVHLGKRPFTCTECGQRFAHKGNLRVHK